MPCLFVTLLVEPFQQNIVAILAIVFAQYLFSSFYFSTIFRGWNVAFMKDKGVTAVEAIKWRYSFAQCTAAELFSSLVSTTFVVGLLALQSAPDPTQRCLLGQWVGKCLFIGLPFFAMSAAPAAWCQTHPKLWLYKALAQACKLAIVGAVLCYLPAVRASIGI